MRHQRQGRKLNRDIQHRKAVFKNLIAQLIEHGAVKTTEAKAKATKSVMDKLITKAKTGTMQARRIIGSFLHHKALVSQLVDTVTPKLPTERGSYTRIVRLGHRRGDNAPIVRLELMNWQGKSKKEAPKKAKTQPKKPIDRKALPKPEAKQRPVKTTIGGKTIGPIVRNKGE